MFRNYSVENDQYRGNILHDGEFRRKRAAVETEEDRERRRKRTFLFDGGYPASPKYSPSSPPYYQPDEPVEYEPVLPAGGVAVDPPVKSTRWWSECMLLMCMRLAKQDLIPLKIENGSWNSTRFAFVERMLVGGEDGHGDGQGDEDTVFTAVSHCGMDERMTALELNMIDHDKMRHYWAPHPSSMIEKDDGYNAIPGVVWFGVDWYRKARTTARFPAKFMERLEMWDFLQLCAVITNNAYGGRIALYPEETRPSGAPFPGPKIMRIIFKYLMEGFGLVKAAENGYVYKY